MWLKVCYVFVGTGNVVVVGVLDLFLGVEEGGEGLKMLKEYGLMGKNCVLMPRC
jgi:hypothetical protein